MPILRLARAEGRSNRRWSGPVTRLRDKLRVPKARRAEHLEIPLRFDRPGHAVGPGAAARGRGGAFPHHVGELKPTARSEDAEYFYEDARFVRREVYRTVRDHDVGAGILQRNGRNVRDVDSSDVPQP